jgi:hypothetical protein
MASMFFLKEHLKGMMQKAGQKAMDGPSGQSPWETLPSVVQTQASFEVLLLAPYLEHLTRTQ